MCCPCSYFPWGHTQTDSFSKQVLLHVLRNSWHFIAMYQIVHVALFVFLNFFVVEYRYGTIFTSCMLQYSVKCVWQLNVKLTHDCSFAEIPLLGSKPLETYYISSHFEEKMYTNSISQPIEKIRCTEFSFNRIFMCS